MYATFPGHIMVNMTMVLGDVVAEKIIIPKSLQRHIKLWYHHYGQYLIYFTENIRVIVCWKDMQTAIQTYANVRYASLLGEKIP